MRVFLTMRIRLLTYNIHKCIGGLDRRYRPDRILAVLEHYAPDVVLLQEVDEGARRSKGHRQVDLIGDALGLPHRAFFPNVQVLGGGVYGNAVLSRHPILRTRNLSLTFPGRKRRSALHAEVSVHGQHGGHPRLLHVFNLHLGLAAWERDWQLERFLASHPFAAIQPRTPVVVGGDLNDVWWTLGGSFFLPAGFSGQTSPARTFPAWAPVRALDGLYVRGDLRLRHVFRSHLREARFASDHLPLFAEMEFHPTEPR
jgi:endonuclease/exonuclease/phosphatase family metal-dependent hydrolase